MRFSPRPNVIVVSEWDIKLDPVLTFLVIRPSFVIAISFVPIPSRLLLIDLIAYISQALSFRVDLNARENFLATAERRNSVLRLARLINYNARRNLPATGLLKVDSISTTEDVIDSTGTNLATQTIIWNDSANSNYREQFTAI